MRFEEKLDRLTERHEALTQTIEIIAAMQKQTERRLEELAQRIDQLADVLTRAVEGVLQIAQNHERRITRLENPGSIPPSEN
jgi:chromosome segregation ATPase